MGKCLGYYKIKEEFEKRGGVLLEEYSDSITSRSKVKYICPCGNESIIQVSSFIHNEKRCKKCHYRNVGSKLRLSQEEVENTFIDSGCELLDIYDGNNAKTLRYRCSCGNISKTQLKSFKAGRRCMNCSGNVKYTQEEVFKLFEERGFKLIGKYVRYNDSVDSLCSCGNPTKISLSSLLNGVKCRRCKIEALSGSNSYMWNPDRKKIRIVLELQSLSNSYKRKLRKKNNINNPNIHVDHIFPIKAFTDNNIYDLKLINHESNLQFLPAKENLRKNAKYNKEEFKKFLEGLEVQTCV